MLTCYRCTMSERRGSVKLAVVRDDSGKGWLEHQSEGREVMRYPAFFLVRRYGNFSRGLRLSARLEKIHRTTTDLTLQWTPRAEQSRRTSRRPSTRRRRPTRAGPSSTTAPSAPPTPSSRTTHTRPSRAAAPTPRPPQAAPSPSAAQAHGARPAPLPVPPPPPTPAPPPPLDTAVAIARRTPPDKGKRRASVSIAVPPTDPAPASAVSPASASASRPLPPLPPPIPIPIVPVASSSSSAGPSRRTPTLPFDGVSGVWAVRPAADSHPPRARKTSDAAPASGSRSASRQRKTSDGLGSAGTLQQPSLQRKTSGGLQRKTSGGLGLTLPRKSSLGAFPPPSPSTGASSSQGPVVIGASQRRKSSLPGSAGRGDATDHGDVLLLRWVLAGAGCTCAACAASVMGVLRTPADAVRTSRVLRTSRPSPTTSSTPTSNSTSTSTSTSTSGTYNAHSAANSYFPTSTSLNNYSSSTSTSTNYGSSTSPPTPTHAHAHAHARGPPPPLVTVRTRGHGRSVSASGPVFVSAVTSMGSSTIGGGGAVPLRKGSDAAVYGISSASTGFGLAGGLNGTGVGGMGVGAGAGVGVGVGGGAALPRPFIAPPAAPAARHHPHRADAPLARAPPYSVAQFECGECGGEWEATGEPVVAHAPDDAADAGICEPGVADGGEAVADCGESGTALAHGVQPALAYGGGERAGTALAHGPKSKSKSDAGTGLVAVAGVPRHAREREQPVVNSSAHTSMSMSHSGSAHTSMSHSSSAHTSMSHASAHTLPPPPPPPPPLLSMAVLRARRSGLEDGASASAYANASPHNASPGTYASPHTNASPYTASTASSAPPWRFSGSTSASGEAESPMTSATTPASGREGGREWKEREWVVREGKEGYAYAGSPLSAQVQTQAEMQDAYVPGAYGPGVATSGLGVNSPSRVTSPSPTLPSPHKRERRRLRLHSAVDDLAQSDNADANAHSPADSDDLHIHSHPLGGDEDELDSALDGDPARGWLATLEGEVHREEMEGVLLSPPTFAAPDPKDLDPDDDALDLYDDRDDFDLNRDLDPDGDDGFDFGAGGYGRHDDDDGMGERVSRGRSPSPIRYARRSSVDVDLLLDSDETDVSSSAEDSEPAVMLIDADGASIDSRGGGSGAPSLFNDARSTFSRARSTRSRRRRRNTRAAPPPVPLGSAAGLNPNRRQRARSADSSIMGAGDALAPSEMWRMEQAARRGAGGTQPVAEMRFVYAAARVPASGPPPPPLSRVATGSGGSYASLSQSGHGHGGGLQGSASHGSSESGGGRQLGGGGAYYASQSTSTSKSSLQLPAPAPVPRKEGLRLLRKEKKEKEKEKAMRKSSSFSLLRGGGGGTANSSAEALMHRGYAPALEGQGRTSSSSGGSDEIGHGRPQRTTGQKPALFSYLYDPARGR
ncbi:hypothetical protein C8R44DRAFT_848692 [Mycena epipterygia]|nr:hypothetical protein C8R44DRAFT_848692 [Mycena epipterygia]